MADIAVEIGVHKEARIAVDRPGVRIECGHDAEQRTDAHLQGGDMSLRITAI
jgi:hypothetical protein